MRITAIEEQKKNKDRRSVFIDGEFAFGMTAADCYLLGLKEGDEISSSELKKIKQTALAADAKNLAVKYLGYAMRTKREVELKLRSYDIGEDIIEAAIEQLVSLRYIDDVDYAEKYVASKRKSGYGDMRIKHELYRKGIDSDIITQSLEECDDTQEKILSLLERRIKSETLTEFNKKEKQKIYNFLNSRGFSYEDTKSAVKAYWDNDNNET